jgi:hypothetical protein
MWLSASGRDLFLFHLLHPLCLYGFERYQVEVEDNSEKVFVFD